MRKVTSSRCLTCTRLICLLFVAITGCASGPTDVLPTASYLSSDSDYIIAPGDTLAVFVWANPDLSVENVPVRPDGKITTPLAEDIKASGKTSAELAREIEERLARFVKYPQVSVTVTEFVGRYSEQIRVIGEATEPQSLPYREGLTALDVVIAVGGLTEFANGNKAVLVRNVAGKQRTFRVRLDDLIKDGDISANVDMFPGDILIIPEVSWF
jgi:polysaccharide export outer membrane protein